ncbi:MAG: DUF2490 domain-containing protein [Parachlamydiaceae bacterium]|nr:DUF2490 domain-containing protein [Parachlamydiaceae bacterium]
MTLSKPNYTALLLSSLFLFASAEAETSTLAQTTPTTPPITDNSFAFPPDTDHPYAPGKRELKLNSNNDRGFWAIVDVKKALSPEWLFLFHTEQRWGSDYTLYWYQQYDFTFLYNITGKIKQSLFCHDGIFKNFFIGGGVAQISQIKRNTKDRFKWVWITRPELEMHLILGYQGWSFEQRLRGQYIHHNNDHYKNYGDCRYRIILTTPAGFSCYGITAYISNEIFLRANTYFKKTNPHGLVGGLFENRFRVGFDLPLITNKLDAKVWWQWRVLKQNSLASRRYNNTYQFGGTLAMTF